MLCVCSRRVCSRRKQELVKTFTAWKILASLEDTGSGTGGYSHRKITGDFPQDRPIFYRKNNGGIWGRWQHLTIYIENVIISVTMITKKLFVTRRAKMPLQGVLPPLPIKSCWTPENAVQRIYIKTGNTKSLKLYAVGGHMKKLYLYISNGAFCKKYIMWLQNGYSYQVALDSRRRPMIE